MAAPKRKRRKKPRKKRSFWDKKRDWDEVLVETPEREITRREIRDYFWDNRDQIFPYLEGRTVMVLFAPKKDFYIYKRHKPKGGLITLTKLEGIDDPNSYEYWVQRRVIEFHTVIGSKTDLIWVDLDPHPKNHDPRVFETMEAVVPKVMGVIKTVFPDADIKVWSSGKRGLHVEGYLPRKLSTDQARKNLRRHLDKAFADDPMFTTGIAKPGQIRLDVTTLKRTGSIRSPYSFTVAGGVKRPWTKAEKKTLADRLTSAMRKLTGRAANPQTLKRRLMR